MEIARKKVGDSEEKMELLTIKIKNGKL